MREIKLQGRVWELYSFSEVELVHLYCYGIHLAFMAGASDSGSCAHAVFLRPLWGVGCPLKH